MGRKCAYPECKSTDGLHSLPSDREVAHCWLQALGRADIPSASVYVCNLHFTRECFSNYGEVEMGFKKQLLLKPDAVPTPAKVVTPGNKGSICQIFPAVRHVGSQTDPPERKSVSTQLSMKTLQNHFRSTATQVKAPSRDCGVCTLTFPLDSPLLFLQPTIVERPSKRARLSIKDEEESPAECSLSVVVQEPEDTT
ncbi:uncharacterized protein LOC122987625 isoform X2 [Thunnus albacares]|uniref:uncharacterized protein LOC121905812 isoform X2 n=1 Tax=Thunnus maccoyii TaxID=8240 RepID=UPI001C4C55F6|nr:uncharacterized protein LOC121905812 isoform X2 [Thunnus maccoyii]XP_044215542.1 uncharacterized protein LOC122987625 isoform X2 [Thunnus albacares]